MNRPGFPGDSNWLGDNGVMGRLIMYSPEVRERAVWMVLEHRGEHRSDRDGCSVR